MGRETIEEIIWDRFDTFLRAQEEYMINIQNKRYEVHEGFERLEDLTKHLRSFITGIVVGRDGK